MSSDVKTFFDAWVARTFAADLPWVDLYPTPLAALADLRASATLAGVDEDDLRAALGGDLVAAVLSAMLDAPAPDAARFGTPPDLTGSGTAAAVMALALSYGDGLRDAIGADHELMATLVLQYLATQGFALRPLNHHPADVRAANLADHEDPSWGARPQ